MNTKTVIGVVAALVVVIGGWWAFMGPVPVTGIEQQDDSGAAGSIQPTASLVVTESMQGRWQSVDDPKFVREFKEGDKVVDWYEGKEVTSGLWVVFTRADGLEVPFPLEDNAVYVQMTETGSQQDTMYFRVSKLTASELEMTYLDRGGVLRFTLVQ